MQNLVDKMDKFANKSPKNQTESYLRDCGIVDEMYSGLLSEIEINPENMDTITDKYSKLDEYLDYVLKMY